MNKKHQVTQVLVTFSGPVNATEAAGTAIYRLATPGKKGSHSAKNAGIIRLAKAIYNSAGNIVTLTPKKPFTLSKSVQLLVSGTGASGLQDSLGRLIDGDHNGQAGGNAVAILGKKGVTTLAVTLLRPSAQTATKADVVDALLETDELPGLRHARREAILARVAQALTDK